VCDPAVSVVTLSVVFPLTSEPVPRVVDRKRQRNAPIFQERVVLKWRDERTTREWENSASTKPGRSRATVGCI
jgi:hypothetical protein